MLFIGQNQCPHLYIRYRLILVALPWHAMHWLVEIVRSGARSMDTLLGTFQCPVRVILSFLPNLIDKGKAFFMVKVYLGDTDACHMGFGKQTVSQHDLIFMKGRRLLPSGSGD